MAEFTHALERVTSLHLSQVASTSKLSAHLITQQLRQLHGARLFRRRHKKVADGLPGCLVQKISLRLKQSLVAMQSTVTVLAQMDLT